MNTNKQINQNRNGASVNGKSVFNLAGYIILMCLFCIASVLVTHLWGTNSEYEVFSILEPEGPSTRAVVLDLNLDESRNNMDVDMTTLRWYYTRYAPGNPDDWGDNVGYYSIIDDYYKSFAWENSAYMIFTGIIENDLYNFTILHNCNLDSFETDLRKFAKFVYIVPEATNDDAVSVIDTPLNSNGFLDFGSISTNYLMTSTDIVSTLYGFALMAVWEDIIPLNNNQGSGGDDSISIYTNSELPTSAKVTVPTRQGYTFLGYYSGDVQYIDKDGNVLQDASLYETLPTELTAMWASADFEVTLSCADDSHRPFMLYIFSGDALYRQVYIAGAELSIALPASDSLYRLQFVGSYYSKLTASASGGSIQQDGNIITLLSGTATQITYAFSIPSFGNMVII